MGLRGRARAPRRPDPNRSQWELAPLVTRQPHPRVQLLSGLPPLLVERFIGRTNLSESSAALTRTVCWPTITCFGGLRGSGESPCATRWGRPLSSFIWRSFRPITFRSAAAAPGARLARGQLEADEAAEPDDGDGRGGGDGAQPDRPAARAARGLEANGRLLERRRAERNGQAGDVAANALTVGAAIEVRLEQQLLELRELRVEAKRGPLTTRGRTRPTGIRLRIDSLDVQSAPRLVRASIVCGCFRLRRKHSREFVWRGENLNG